MNWFLHPMKAAAYERHRMLVQFWYPPGLARQAAHERHEGIVEAVYSIFGV